jgi:hypothetical protein
MLLAPTHGRMYPSHVSAIRRCVLPMLLFAAAACSSSSDDNRANQNLPTVTHAVVKLQRTKSTNVTVTDQANVLFSVLRMPATLDSRNIVRLVGLSANAPDLGQCERLDYADTPTEATASVQRVELLDVGDVSLSAAGRSSLLVRQAFPTVTDFIAGVVYTKRDLSSAPLPPATSYTLAARGALGVSAFKINVNAPLEPSDVMIDGIALSQVSRLSRGQSVQFTWKPGAPGDKVEIQIKNPDRPGDVSCVFDDAAGKGHLPSDAFVAPGTVRLEFHRLRTASSNIKGFDRTQIEFDYSLDHLLELVD